MKYEAPKYVDEGDRVIMRWPSDVDPRRGLVVVVECACGSVARVVNRRRGVDTWVPIDELRIQTK